MKQGMLLVIIWLVILPKEWSLDNIFKSACKYIPQINIVIIKISIQAQNQLKWLRHAAVLLKETKIKRNQNCNITHYSSDWDREM
jgi:hypothetical protein